MFENENIVDTIVIFQTAFFFSNFKLYFNDYQLNSQNKRLIKFFQVKSRNYRILEMNSFVKIR